jgi:hypothetical protein
MSFELSLVGRPRLYDQGLLLIWRRRGVEPAGRGPGGVLAGLPGRGVGLVGAQVGGGLAGRFLGCVGGEARKWALPVSSVVEGDPLGFG